MDRESAQPLARRAIAVLTDPRTIRFGASIFYPGMMSALVGVSGTILNVGVTALAVWPVRHAHPPVYLLSLVLVFTVGLPAVYFVLGGRYGLARAAFSVYEAARPAVIELVIEQVRAQNAESLGVPPPATPGRPLHENSEENSEEKNRKKVPRPVRWLMKAILTIAGAGDRLTDAVAEIDKHEHRKTAIVEAIVDDLVLDNLVAPARNLILVVTIVNAALLVAMFLVV